MMNQRTPRPAAEVEAELLELQSKEKSLSLEIAKIKRTLEAKQKRHRELIGSPWDRFGGKILAKNKELEGAKRYEADATKPVVVWKTEDRYNPGEKIVSRVTPKRIYIRKCGESHETIYNRDGTAQYGSQVIDIEATLGDTAKAALPPSVEQMSAESFDSFERLRKAMANGSPVQCGVDWVNQEPSE